MWSHVPKPGITEQLSIGKISCGAPLESCPPGYAMGSNDTKRQGTCQDFTAHCAMFHDCGPLVYCNHPSQNGQRSKTQHKLQLPTSSAT